MSTSAFTVITPKTIDETNLISSNVPETDYAVWDSGTTYSTGARVIMTSGVHKIYESIVNSNLNNQPNLSPIQWVEVGPTNKYKMFDTSTGTITTNPSSIDFSFTADRVNSIGLVDINATKVTVRARETSVPNLVWNFNGTLDGWSSYYNFYGSLSAGANTATLESSFVSPWNMGFIANYNLTPFLGSSATKIRIRMSKPTNNIQWVGRLYYGIQFGHADHDGYKCFAPEPIWDADGWGIATWDMSQSTQPADWMNAVVNYIRLDLIVESPAPSQTQIDWIDISSYYIKEIDVPDRAIIGDWYDYFYAENFRATELMIRDIPALMDTTFTVTINSTAGNAECGSFIIGNSAELGLTQYGAGRGITDYSVKSTDQFGKTTLTQRPFSKKIDVKLYVESDKVDAIISKLDKTRSQVCLWLAANGIYEQMSVYGFYRDYKVEITYPTYSVLSLEIEGLT